MTVAEFLAWDPDDGTGAVWQLLRPDGTWPERPDLIGPEDELGAQSIGFAVP
jgi:hypothetical protein